ncbi:SAF domain-containing protein [Corallococcus carmarthensis]|uniref:SAF domain-containing protein n=1 Tax=Corallococcus carmarthensis TaxID=2316728 RepID=A0A3A8KTS3_9BACT|nr:SAF domain-containing protein [Corallococcus carmarthensis]RKH07635.1 hypothetical protein D7X32_00740 [Corallococcus carmarthensis]
MGTMRPRMLVPVLLFALTGGAAPPSEEAKGFVLVSVRDIPAGEQVQEQDLTEVPLPPEWRSEGLINPSGRAYIVGQRLQLPVLKGDIFAWALFENRRDMSFSESCVKALGWPRDAAEQVARARQVLVERQP